LSFSSRAFQIFGAMFFIDLTFSRLTKRLHLAPLVL
jgi:hypothetical protein